MTVSKCCRILRRVLIAAGLGTTLVAVTGTCRPAAGTLTLFGYGDPYDYGYDYVDVYYDSGPWYDSCCYDEYIFEEDYIYYP
jgi:hypothetical protein